MSFGNAHVQELEGDLPVLNIMPDKPRPALQTFNGTEVWFNLTKEVELPRYAVVCFRRCAKPLLHLSAQVVDAADKAARMESTTQFTVLLAGMPDCMFLPHHANGLVLIQLPPL